MSAGAEKLLDQVRREPANKTCPNCLKEDKLGFDAVCFQFKTFICSTCKSAHQGYSHRCKSVRMSNWTKEEVDQLKAENGGGNANCMAVWLGNIEAQGGRRPVVGAEDRFFKQFIDEAYNRSAFYKAGGMPATTAPAAAIRQQSAAPTYGSSGGSNGNGNGNNGGGFASFGGAPPAVSAIKSAPANMMGDDLLGGGA
ncbi:hypothetical protein T492DRAFT_868982 [Pavlovales sp. CCMP2436]|nr:hypothetical protein T492DRAFT_868982 [Pavlovales sp. CCMP2436]